MTPAELHKFADRLERLYALGGAEADGIAAIRAIADARLDAGWADPPAVTAGDVRAVRFVPRLRDHSHLSHQQGDEMACRCGKRWPVGEEHP